MPTISDAGKRQDDISVSKQEPAVSKVKLRQVEA